MTSVKPMLRYIVAPGGAFALVLAIGVTLAAAVGLPSSRSSVAVGPNPAAGSVTAKCRPGQKIVSGGFESAGFNPMFGTGPSVLPYSSFKAGKASWTVAAKNQSSRSGSITAFAFCAPSVGKINPRSASVTIGPGFAVGSARAKCPSGQKIVAGGTNSPGFTPSPSVPGPRVFPFSSYKSGSAAWKASAVNTSSNRAGTLQVLAYCAAYPGVSKGSASKIIGPALASGGATAKCRGLLLSGGFRAPTFSTSGTALLPYKSRMAKGGTGWRVSVFNDSPTATAGRLRVFAYCLK
jgi:hypothetical protein